MNSVFSTSSYRHFLKDWLKNNHSHGLMRALAQSMGCHNSHLTRILKDEVHMTMDQAFGACEHLKLTDAETEYFLKLVEYDRGASPNYKKKIKLELTKLKESHQNLAQKFQEPRLGSSALETLYYSSWHWLAIHIATTVPELQSIASIAKRFNLDEAFVRESLLTLERYGFVNHRNGIWKANEKFNIHLPKTSPMSSVMHNSWRDRATMDTQKSKTDGLHYTVVQSLSKEDFENIKELLLEAVERYKKIADKSKEEELACFCIDFFKI